MRHSWLRFMFWRNSTISFYMFTSLSHLYLLYLSGLSKIEPVCRWVPVPRGKISKISKKENNWSSRIYIFPNFCSDLPLRNSWVQNYTLRCRLWRIDLRQERRGFHLPQARWRRPPQKTFWKRLWQRVLRGMCYSQFGNGQWGA